MNAERHHRQRILPQVGEAGQGRLRQASILVVGLGALGSPVALYLAAAGVGRLGLLDDQRIELSNLNRQVLYQTGDLGRRKVGVARERLLALDPALLGGGMAAAPRPGAPAGRPPEVPKLTDNKVISYDAAKCGSTAGRKRLLERWEREINSAAK